MSEVVPSDVTRLDRVENEVGVIRSELGGLKTDMGRVQSEMKGFGAILSRIEQGFLRAQEQQDAKDASSRHNPVAVATVLITIMSMMVGGAWVIGSNIGHLDERSAWMEKLIDRNEQRLWASGHYGGDNGQSSPTHQ